MSPGAIRTIGIVFFAIAFVLILISHNASYVRHENAQARALLNELSSRLAVKYFYGSAPETLEELLDEDDWKDPWGTRFRYVQSAQYFLLWSAGSDKKFEPLESQRDDVLVFDNGLVESWTNDSLIDILNQSDHAALAQIMFAARDPELKRAASHWSVETGFRLSANYKIR